MAWLPAAVALVSVTYLLTRDPTYLPNPTLQGCPARFWWIFFCRGIARRQGRKSLSGHGGW